MIFQKIIFQEIGVTCFTDVPPWGTYLYVKGTYIYVNEIVAEKTFPREVVASKPALFF